MFSIPKRTRKIINKKKKHHKGADYRGGPGDGRTDRVAPSRKKAGYSGV
jgi:hypothetical protein